ncbi:MAG: putative glycosyltransferase [Candidatus Collierbacteria bacterium GW2011_GWF2_44_15]|uniref:Putative glycosyltransferase n=4 Tax=Candidatus Collieribacteriota TaxID=1752725 RepID=A0A0G1KFR0_9BACT|nr:MAG: putative glycosyltransferase [Candidatus Collierbacteria bacterium GW2011_GWA1_44_12]KKT46684.1 MAG: putative glycosyltransferase [Candidatus Collierbacteria bacterium GW2011_GWF2_44_15]KKU29494.1 MAG: putative glycosyltransferase [Candidatus Collierbacteria bacterium GW2011_GWE1_46_18]
MKIAYIHKETKQNTGAGQINSLIISKLRGVGVSVKGFFPRLSLNDPPLLLKGLSNILFFYTLLEHRRRILSYDIIQGTTYTPLAFLLFKTPVVSHFGSTSFGFLESTPLAKDLGPKLRKIWIDLKKNGVLRELNLKTRRPIRDIAEIEIYVAKRVNTVVATSEKVKNELVLRGVDPEKVVVIHNAIEDYWFEDEVEMTDEPKLVFLGRMGEDAFTLKLKGLDRLVDIYKSFPELQKLAVVMTRSKKLTGWLMKSIKNLKLAANYPKEQIRSLLRANGGSILLLTSRYEGFSLSLIEGMSQGMIPIAYSVGVVPEVIRDGENGFIVENQDEAKRKIKLILSDNDLRLKMARQCIKDSQNFRSDIMVRKLFALYKNILDNHKVKSKRRNFK